jgi:spore coat-associated protein N
LSRLKVLVTQPRMALGALLTIALAGAAVVGSGADFTASSANPENVFTAGTLKMDNTSKDAAILTAAGLRPGAVARTGVVDIENTGSLSGRFSVTRSSLDNSDTANPLSGKLSLVVRDCGSFGPNGEVPTCDAGDGQVYAGSVTGMDVAAHDLGTFPAGAKHRYEFALSLGSSAGDAYQGGSSTVGFTWSAAS